MFRMISQLEVDAADGRFKAYHDVVDKFPNGVCYLAGPNVDATARAYFSAFASTTLKTPGGVGKEGVDVEFRVADTAWGLLRDGNAVAEAKADSLPA